jgi:hypothetical protein
VIEKKKLVRAQSEDLSHPPTPSLPGTGREGEKILDLLPLPVPGRGSYSILPLAEWNNRG